MAKEKAHILLVEDEEVQRSELTYLLQSENYRVSPAATVKEAVDIINKEQIDITLSDFSLPDGTGHDILSTIKKINPTIPVVFITAFGSVDGAVEAMKTGVVDYLTKPIEVDKLLSVIDSCLDQKLTLSEIDNLREESSADLNLEGIIAQSSSMKEILSLVSRVAKSDATVLIRGESGTGKEVIARLIHNAGNRSKEKFVAFNAAALSPSLIESELFGHVKGSFTGATSDRPGRFVEADKGTIFIDEVGDIPISCQPKFLRVLQESYVEPVGAVNNVKVDIRVIAATNRELERMIEDNSFRSDLYYRLNVVEIKIPPLRERKEDIKPLCHHFLKKFTAKNNKELSGFSSKAFDRLMRYDYPGNVRELENIIERAVILSRSDAVAEQDLPRELLLDTKTEHHSDDGLDDRISSMEAQLISEALKAAGGNQSKAARALNISERKLRYKIKKLNLQ